MKDYSKNNKKYRYDENAAKKTQDILDKLIYENDMTNKYDPFGSYTGYPIEPDEKPVQDADDL